MGDRIEFVAPITEAAHTIELRVPDALDSRVGHYEFVKMRRRGTGCHYCCYLARIKNEETGDVQLFFGYGWKDLCQENEIRVPGLVIFTYVGHGLFIFAVVGLDRLVCRPPSWMRVDPEKDLAEKGKATGRAPSWVGSGDHADATVVLMSSSQYDFFILETKSGHQTINSIAIPTRFVKRSLPYEAVKKLPCLVQDPMGREWPMRICFSKKNGATGPLLGAHLAGGFKPFAAAHQLPEKAVLAFELYSLVAPLLLKVHIFTK